MWIFSKPAEQLTEADLHGLCRGGKRPSVREGGGAENARSVNQGLYPV